MHFRISFQDLKHKISTVLGDLLGQFLRHVIEQGIGRDINIAPMLGAYV